jgi:transcriptional antiterminator NusG
MKWYVIRVTTGKEKKTKEFIEFEIKDRNLNANLKMPMENKVIIRNGKKVNMEKPYFPGYLFIETDSINELEGIIKHINGVSSILKQPLSSKEIDRFLKDNDTNSEEMFYPKQNIKIIDGPFSSFVGTIYSVDEKNKLVKVSVILFERENIVELKFSQIASK